MNLSIAQETADDNEGRELFSATIFGGAVGNGAAANAAVKSRDSPQKILKIGNKNIDKGGKVCFNKRQVNKKDVDRESRCHSKVKRAGVGVSPVPVEVIEYHS